MAVTQTHNIGIIAHIDAGKTTTTERILFATGAVHKVGEVDDGTASMDWMEQEQNRGITITSAATTISWNNHNINLIDTPGHVDFTIEVERSLRVLDGAVGVFCAVGGVEPQSETVWHQSKHYNVAKIAYINKMDRLGADFEKTLLDIEEKLGEQTLPFTIPIGSEKEFEGIIDVLKQKELHWNDINSIDFVEKDIRPELQQKATRAYTAILEKASEFSDEVAEKYLAEQTIETQEILAAIKKAVLQRAVLPVFCGSSLKNIGIQTLLDGITHFLPKLEEAQDFKVYDYEDITQEKEWIATTKPLAFVFKSALDKHYGLMHFVRVYSGVLKDASTTYDLNTGKKERIMRIFKMHSNKTTQVSALSKGDIGVVVGPKHTRTGHTLASEIRPRVLLENISVPEPVISSTVEVHNISDRDKLLEVLEKLAIEDPSFHYSEDENTGQVIISGMGELHLEVLATRIKDEYSVPARLGNPQVRYRESISKEVTEKFNMTHMPGNEEKEYILDITLKVRPIKESKNTQGVIESSKAHPEYGTHLGSSIYFKHNLEIDPKDTIKKLVLSFIEKAICDSASTGIVEGYPCINIAVSLENITFDSSEIPDEGAFQYASSHVFQRALEKAGPIKMEPIMDVNISTPDEFIGEAVQTITQRHGIVHEVTNKGAFSIINAEAPLKSLFGYSTTIRSATQGRASFSIKFSHYKILE